jgi:hypothetical protein
MIQSIAEMFVLSAPLTVDKSTILSGKSGYLYSLLVLTQSIENYEFGKLSTEAEG